MSRSQSIRLRGAMGHLCTDGNVAVAEGADRAGGRHSILTFRAWFVAQFSAAEWESLDKISRVMWMDYLRWYRDVLALPVENGVEVLRIDPLDGFLALELAGGGRILTRKVVMATGREGLGRPRIPDFHARRAAPLLGAHLGRHRLRCAARQAGCRGRRRSFGDGQCRRGAGGGLRGTAHAGPCAKRCRGSTS